MMRWLTFVVFLVSMFSAHAGFMNQVDELTRGAISREFSNAERVDIEDVTFNIQAQSTCDVHVESQALVHELGLEDQQKSYECLTCLVKVNLKAFEIKKNRCLLMN